MNAPVNHFAPMPSRLVGEREERVALAGKRMRFHHAFIDDYLRGIAPDDLVIISAPTGLGKTEIALWIATQNALAGRRVHYFALEAAPRELERRAKYSLIVRLARAANHPQADDLNYADWLFGECEHVAGDFNAAADAFIAERFSQLSTFYRGSKFDAEDLTRVTARIHERTDLIVVDHLHYIDEDIEQSEARALGDIVKAIRETQGITRKPVILVAHIRKRETGRHRPLIPNYEDIHGSSNIVKVATQIVILERATTIERTARHLSPTYVHVEKDRRLGQCPLVAVQDFDLTTRSYAKTYTLGWVRSNKWEEADMGSDIPRWALGHRSRAPQQTMPHPSEVSP